MAETSGKAKRKTLYLIDGHAQFFRAYHAIRSGMQSPVTKEPTNMTFGFVGMLLKVLRQYRPDYLAVAIDVAGDRETFRSVIYPEYKANRESAPDDFHPQVERCLDLLEQMHVPVVGEEGVEADDVIATVVRRLRAEHPELDIRIVSRDKDLAQILDEHVELFDVHTDLAVGPSDL
ncbi:MAG: 5'-3' exonuclease, partial [Planctomycetota bacterium]